MEFTEITILQPIPEGRGDLAAVVQDLLTQETTTSHQGNLPITARTAQRILAVVAVARVAACGTWRIKEATEDLELLSLNI